MTPLQNVLQRFRTVSQTQREQGTYFEKLVEYLLSNDPQYKDTYEQVWLWEAWRQVAIQRYQTDPGVDTGIDLVAETATGDIYAIQAKCYAEDTTLYKKDIDSFFTASGKTPFTHRLIVLSTDRVSNNFEDALKDQQIPTHQITLSDIENSKIDWDKAYPNGALTPKITALAPKQQLRDYQKDAIKDVIKGLKVADRGKLIMACGTGKTLTALRLAEEMVGAGRNVLFLVPSLNLMSQTFRAWTQEANIPLHSYAVCSDSQVGKRYGKSDDESDCQIHELSFHATTDAKALATAHQRRADSIHLSVIFGTYHSIDVIRDAQQHHGLPHFDLIICDEAHRTTGVGAVDNKEESAFVRVHDNQAIRGNKRLYMTATPRIYAAKVKKQAKESDVLLYSMDDEAQYGENLHVLPFAKAVHDLGALCDYKVVVLTVMEKDVAQSSALQNLLADEENTLQVSDAAKIVGCYRALSKIDFEDRSDILPMQRAVAFAQMIQANAKNRTHQVGSKNIEAVFSKVVEAYKEDLCEADPIEFKSLNPIQCEVKHVDGSMGAIEKERNLAWLRSSLPPPPPNHCFLHNKVSISLMFIKFLLTCKL